MTRDELIASCFGRTDFPPAWQIVEMLDEATGDLQSHVEVYLRRVVVRTPGLGGTTVTVAGIGNICTDPAYRRRGFAAALVRRAHVEIQEHQPIRFAALFSDRVDYFARLGYFHPAGASDPTFLVCELSDESWPPGRVDTRGTW